MDCFAGGWLNDPSQMTLPFERFGLVTIALFVNKFGMSPRPVGQWNEYFFFIVTASSLSFYLLIFNHQCHQLLDVSGATSWVTTRRRGSFLQSKSPHNRGHEPPPTAPPAVHPPQPFSVPEGQTLKRWCFHDGRVAMQDFPYPAKNSDET